jgi:hypothetical protein
MAKFQMTELVSEFALHTARLGAGTGSSNHVDDKEVGKAVKLGADSRYVLCSAGDPIEGFVAAVEAATLDDYSIGSVQVYGRRTVIADGLQANPGAAATIAVGDYVVAGTMVAKGTALTDYKQKVCKATYQPSAEVVEANVNEVAKLLLAPWRVVSILGGGTGAVGDTIVIERV